MEQTKLKKENERLTMSVSIKRGLGYSFTKDVIRVFAENEIKYKFMKTKSSAVFNLGNWYIKVYFPFYSDGKVDICMYEPNVEAKKCVDLFIQNLARIHKPSSSNRLNIASHTAFESLNESICTINKKEYTNYTVNKEGKMYSVNNKLSYALNVERMNSKRIKCKDTLNISVELSTAGLITFAPNLFTTFFTEADNARKEILNKIED